MLIEQIIEFELRGPGSPGGTCTPITGNFMKRNSLSGLLFTANILQGGSVLYFTSGPNHLQLKFTP